MREGEDTEQQGEIRKDRWMEKLLKVLAEKEETEERDDTKGTGKPGHNLGKLLCCAFPLLGFPQYLPERRSRRHSPCSQAAEIPH